MKNEKYIINTSRLYPLLPPSYFLPPIKSIDLDRLGTLIGFSGSKVRWLCNRAWWSSLGPRPPCTTSHIYSLKYVCTFDLVAPQSSTVSAAVLHQGMTFYKDAFAFFNRGHWTASRNPIPNSALVSNDHRKWKWKKKSDTQMLTRCGDLAGKCSAYHLKIKKDRVSKPLRRRCYSTTIRSSRIPCVPCLRPFSPPPRFDCREPQREVWLVE